MSNEEEPDRRRLTWKNDLTSLTFGLLSKSVAPLPKDQNGNPEDPEYWATFQKGYRLACEIVAKPFSWGAEIGNPLNFCPDGENILAVDPGMSSRGIKMPPRDILLLLEDCFSNARIEHPDVDGIMMSCRHAIMTIRTDWFCQHWWVDGEPEFFKPDKDSPGVWIATEYCAKPGCGITREKTEDK